MILNVFTSLLFLFYSIMGSGIYLYTIFKGSIRKCEPFFLSKYFGLMYSFFLPPVLFFVQICCDPIWTTEAASAIWNHRKSTVVTLIPNPWISVCSTKPLIEHLETRMKPFLGGLPVFPLKLAILHMSPHARSLCHCIHHAVSACIISIVAPNRD